MNPSICIQSIIITSFFTQLSLHSFTVILIFTIFNFFKYITEPKLYCARIFWRLLYNA